MKTLKDYSITEIQEIILQCKSLSEVLRKLNIPKNGGNLATLKLIILNNRIDISHFTYGANRLTKNCCIICGKEIGPYSKFCSNTCKAEYDYKVNVEEWKQGNISGLSGELDIRGFVRRYLFEKYNNSCQYCGWNIMNPYTGLVPLQIHHIDGNCKNNSEENLQLLCPNCHSLTENFGSRNDNCTRIDLRKRG